jgi:hypothetical protein
VEALVDVGAARRFADGVQVPLPQSALEPVERFEMRAALARPFRQPRGARTVPVAKSADLNSTPPPNEHQMGTDRTAYLVHPWLAMNFFNPASSSYFLMGWPGVFQFGLALSPSIFIRAHQHARQVVAPGRHQRRETLVLEGAHHHFGVRLLERHHLPIRAGASSSDSRRAPRRRPPARCRALGVSWPAAALASGVCGGVSTPAALSGVGGTLRRHRLRAVARGVAPASDNLAERGEFWPTTYPRAKNTANNRTTINRPLSSCPLPTPVRIRPSRFSPHLHRTCFAARIERARRFRNITRLWLGIARPAGGVPARSSARPKDAIISSGSGKTMVVFFSVPISTSVCR